MKSDSVCKQCNVHHHGTLCSCSGEEPVDKCFMGCQCRYKGQHDILHVCSMCTEETGVRHHHCDISGECRTLSPQNIQLHGPSLQCIHKPGDFRERLYKGVIRGTLKRKKWKLCNMDLMRGIVKNALKELPSCRHKKWIEVFLGHIREIADDLVDAATKLTVQPTVDEK